MNSIEVALGSCPQSVTAEVALVLRSHFHDSKRLVVVEGPTDKEIFTRFYGAEKFDVYCSAKFPGCISLPDVLKALNGKYLKRLIAIKDADFDHLKGVKYEDIPNLFLTDTHDLETMMLTEDFYRLLETSLGVSDAKRLVICAIDDIVHLGYIKFLNDVGGLKLVFKKCCRVGNCYDGNGCVDIEDWLANIYSHTKNSGKRRVTTHDVELFESNVGISEGNMLQLTNGHDMVVAVANKVKATCKRNCSKEAIASILKQSYTYASYSKTSLCAAVDSWLSRN